MNKNLYIRTLEHTGVTFLMEEESSKAIEISAREVHILKNTE